MRARTAECRYLPLYKLKPSDRAWKALLSDPVSDIPFHFSLLGGTTVGRDRFFESAEIDLTVDE